MCFPIAKIGALFSITTGAAIALAITVLNTHDVRIARQLYASLNPRDILLGDRAFCTYADLVLVQSHQADMVFRKHQSRKLEIREGKCLSQHSQLVIWNKPNTCPHSISKSDLRRQLIAA